MRNTTGPFASSVWARLPFGPSWHSKNKRKLRTSLKEAIQKTSLASANINPDAKYVLHLVFRAKSWNTKQGKVRRVDLLNLAKIVEDEVARALGYDDSHNFKIVLEKELLRGKDNEEHVSVLLARL